MAAGERHGKPATIYDVARVAGVSHQTVSRYLRGFQRIRPENRDRVEQALRQLDYRTNVAARNLRRGRTGTIALSIPSLNQPYFAELAQSVIHAARRHDLAVFVETTEGDRDRELLTLGRLRSGVVDGVLFHPSTLGRADLELARVDVPLVLLGDRIVGSRFDHVTMANRDAAALAVAHLLDGGRRRVVALGVEDPGPPGASALRLAGYRAAHEGRGIPVDPALTVRVGEWVRRAGDRAMEDLIAARVPFDAVFGFNDALALGALRALHRAGLRVPDDVAVVGFDDTEDAEYSTPGLTSISPGRDEIADRAVDVLVDRMAGSAAVHLQHETQFHLVQRASTPGPRRTMA